MPSPHSQGIRPSRREYYPLFLDLTGRRVVVIGGGQVAERKVRGLATSGASIRVVSPTVTPGLRRMARAGRIAHLHRRWRPADLRGAWLVYAATDDRAVNRQITDVARRSGCLVNAVDQPAEGNVLVPSVVRRGDLMIAISTGGLSPALARRVRLDLMRYFGPEYRAFLTLMAQVRTRLRREVGSEALRHRLMRRLVESDLLRLLRLGKKAEVRKRLRELTELHQVGP